MREVAFVCVETAVKTIGSRLTDGDDKPIPGTGSYVAFASGLGLVAYSTPKVLELERPGDKVQVCLIAVPKGCPKGDDRTLSTCVAALIPSVDDSDWWIAVGAGVAGKADLTKPAGAGEENQRSRPGRP